MLSYQHAYHAGSISDLHKHSALVTALRLLKPKTYLETHAGRAVYDLTAAPAQKTGEAEAGALQVLFNDTDDALAEFAKFQSAQRYLGSPALARAVLTKQARVDLAELHPQEFAALEAWAQSEPKVTAHRTDGYGFLARNFKPDSLALIDPSYELKSEYSDLADVLRAQALGRAHIMVWVPLFADRRERALLEPLEALGQILYSRLNYKPLNHSGGYSGIVGTGVLILGPQAGRLRKPLSAIVKALAARLQPYRTATAACGWLV